MISDILLALVLFCIALVGIIVFVLLIASLSFEKTFKAIDERLAKAVRGKTE